MVNIALAILANTAIQRNLARRGKGEGMLRKERWPCSAIEDMSQGREESVLCMNLSSACGHRATDSPGLSNTGIE
ncbi:hypothetical protein EJB05_50552, partial [Eragrostis curvula]